MLKMFAAGVVFAVVLCGGFVSGQAPPVDPKGRCECSIFVETTRGVGDSYAGPLWTLEHDNEDEYQCDDYLQSVCYLYCEQQMEQWLDETQSLDDEVEIEVSPGEWQTYSYGEFFCQRSLQAFPGNPENYDGIRNEPLLLAVRIAAGDCRPWEVKADFDQFRLCCNPSAEYFPQDVCPFE